MVRWWRGEQPPREGAVPKQKMNPDEVDIDAPLVARLVATQFPQWGHLPLAGVRSAGTDNTIYRLGGGLAVRLPRRPGAVAEVARQQRWLPRLAPLLPLAVPVPLAHGVPGPGYPFPWLVYRWLDGQNVLDEPDLDLPDAAVRLGRFSPRSRGSTPPAGRRRSAAGRSAPSINGSAMRSATWARTAR